MSGSLLFYNSTFPRPYLNIHSSDFAEKINNNRPRQGYIIGCTSPLLFSACRHWPHVLTMHNDTSSSQGNVFGTTSKAQSSHSFREAQGGQSGLFSERKRTIKRNDEVLKLAQDRVKAGDCMLFSNRSAHTNEECSPTGRCYTDPTFL